MTEATAKAIHSGLTPRDFVKFMKEARRSGTLTSSLDTYIERLATEGRLQHIPLLPSAFEKKLYLNIARLLVFSFQRSVFMFDQAKMLGHVVKVTSMPSLPKGRRNLHRTSSVGEAQLSAIVDKMMASNAVDIPLVPTPLKRRLFVNCTVVIFQLIEDLLTGEGEEVNFMGHRLRFWLDPQPLEIVRSCLEEQPVSHCTIDEEVLSELVEELLDDEETNAYWVPDTLEGQIYKSVMRLKVRMIEEIACRMRLRLLGREVSMTIVSHADQRANEVIQPEKQSEDKFYFEEEKPFITVSVSELEERLKDLDEQRRVLEALRQLGGAEFDLTADKPMLQQSGKVLEAGVAPAEEEQGSEGSAAAPEVHEFQRVVASEKLARCLNVTVEVDADIAVPYTLIANVETYPDWMPWCTSGKMLTSPEGEDGGDDLISTGDFKGDVGFGFETGTFLGTVGDTVHYGIKTISPGQRSSPSTTPSSAASAESEGSAQEEEVARVQPRPRHGRVVADAIDGFAYGDRLVYDWQFKSVGPSKTHVELNMLFQARSVIYMPLWDSMQTMVITKMLDAFKRRAEEVERTQKAAQS